jgi:hypothetical protein
LRRFGLAPSRQTDEVRCRRGEFPRRHFLSTVIV